jgi:hypothetical protein
MARQLSRDKAVAETHAKFRDEVLRLVPDTWVGQAGMGGNQPGRSWDWPALGRANSLLCLRPEARGEACLFRFFMEPDTVRGVWFDGSAGERTDLARLRWLPWRSLFDGCNSVWFQNPYGAVGGSCETGFRPDLVPYGCWRALGEETHRLQAGVDRLLLSAEPEDGAVALVYSRPSALVSSLDAASDDHVAALAAMARLLDDAGISYQVIPAADLEEGAALWTRHRAILLPSCTALSDGAAASLHRFAAEGGLVLTDWRLGRCDETGKTRDQSPFDGLFGMDPGTVAGGCGVFQPQGGGIPGLLARTRVDGDIRLRQSWAGRLVEGIPILVHAKYGKGQAIYLNFSVVDYPAGGGGLPEWMRRTLARDGIPEPVQVRGTRITARRWQRGEGSIIGLLRHPYSPRTGEKVELVLPDDRYAYDLLEGRYLGKGGSAVFQLAPGEARLVSLEPERISKIDFERLTEEEFLSPAYRITVRAGRKPAPGRCVRFRLIDPAGNPYPAADMTLDAPDGVCEYDVPLGLAPPTPGRWRLEATDVATGVRADVSFNMTHAN